MRFGLAVDPQEVARELSRQEGLPFVPNPAGIYELATLAGLVDQVPTISVEDLDPKVEAIVSGHRVPESVPSETLVGGRPRWLQTVDQGWESPDMPIRSVADLVVLFIHGYPVVMDKAGRVVPELSARLWPILPLYDKELAAMASTTHVVEEAFLASGDEQTTNFCHFTLDTLGRVGSLWSAGLGGIPLLVPEPTYAWQADYLTGVRGGGAVVSPQSSFSAIAAKKLYFTDDYGSRLLHPAYKGAPWALGYLNSLRTLLPGADAAGELPDRIFVGRGDAAQRRLDTEVEFAQALVELGFVHLHLTELAVGQQAEVFRHASVVVGVHGAGLANAAYLKPGSTLVEITGDSYNPPMFQIVAKARRVRYASIMGKNNGIDTPQADIEMEVEPAVTALRSFIDGVGGTPRTPLQAA